MSLRRLRSHRPLFEPLEDRCVPATVTNTNPSGSGSLQQAILDTPSGGTVTFQPGLGTIALSSNLIVSKNLTIDGGAGVTITSSTLLFNIDDVSTSSVLTINLKGLRFTGNGSAGNGGAIMSNENLTVTNCTIVGSNAINGAGIFNGPNTLNIVSSTITGNTAQRGAGVASTGTVNITSSTVSGNIASIDGGGFYNGANRTATITGSTISGNSATGNGGGIFADLGTTTTISNSTISGNSAGNSGGGIIASINGSLGLTNCTVTGNRADSDGNAGAGLLGGGVVAGVPTTAAFNNTIVAGNVKGVGAGTPDDINAVATGSNNLIGDAASSGGLTNNVNSNKVGNNGAGTININSVLSTALAPNGGRTMTHALVAASPALDAGSNGLATGLANDQRDTPFLRIANTTVDIGAYERQTISGLALVVVNPIDENDGDYSPGDLSLREAIGLANGSAGANSINIAITGTQVLALGELRITDDVTVNGPMDLYGNPLLTISGNNASRVLNVDDGTAASNIVTVRGLRLSGGSNPGGLGGAIYNTENLTLTRAVLAANTASEGGGLYNAGTLALSNSTIAGNTGSFRGGGIVNAGAGNVSFTTLSLNSAGSAGGGGIYNTATLTLTSSTLTQNSSGDFGGGIHNFSTLTVVNSTFSANTAVSTGGGIANVFAGTATITNSTFTANRGSSSGGLNVNTSLGAVTRLFNTIVAGNLNSAGTSNSDVSGGAVDAASRNNLIGDAGTSGGLSNGVNGNIVGVNGAGTRAIATILNPTLADNGGLTQTHALVQNSLAIAAASNTATNFSAYDQRDVFRDPNAPDIGAYEVQHPLSPVGTPSTYARTFLPKPSADANTAFVKGLYQSALLRDPDSAGLAGWVAALEGGAMRPNVAYGFVNSTENRTRQVAFFYKYFLGRDPDPTGLATWVSTLQSGVDEGTVMSGFLLSPEFTGQNDNASFVNLMYYAILGRQADPAGFAGWKSQLDNNQLTRGQVGDGFLRSIESITRVVTSDFGSYLKRTTDSAGASPFVAQIQSGVTFGRVAANILGSDEFFFFAGQNIN